VDKRNDFFAPSGLVHNDLEDGYRTNRVLHKHCV